MVLLMNQLDCKVFLCMVTMVRIEINVGKSCQLRLHQHQRLHIAQEAEGLNLAFIAILIVNIAIIVATLLVINILLVTIVRFITILDSIGIPLFTNTNYNKTSKLVHTVHPPCRKHHHGRHYQSASLKLILITSIEGWRNEYQD